MEHIYPLVQEFRSERTAEQIERMKHRADLKKNRLLRGGGHAVNKSRSKAVTLSDSEEDMLEIYESEESEDEESSDSCD